MPLNTRFKLGKSRLSELAYSTRSSKVQWTVVHIHTYWTGSYMLRDIRDHYVWYYNRILLILICLIALYDHHSPQSAAWICHAWAALSSISTKRSSIWANDAPCTRGPLRWRDSHPNSSSNGHSCNIEVGSRPRQILSAFSFRLVGWLIESGSKPVVIASWVWRWLLSCNMIYEECCQLLQIFTALLWWFGFYMLRLKLEFPVTCTR